MSLLLAKKTASKSKKQSKPASKAKSSSKSTSKKSKKAESGSDDEGVDKIRLPGQKYDTPPVEDGVRTFYESLMTQNPKSKMALKWCIEHGLLSLELQKKHAGKV